MSKHTPGPWVYFSEDRFADVRPPYPAKGSTAGYGPICIVRGDARLHGDGVRDANARLIAAAPDMLSALQKFEAWSKAENNHEGTTFMERVQMLMDLDACVRAAIAKATGEQE